MNELKAKSPNNILMAFINANKEWSNSHFNTNPKCQEKLGWVKSKESNNILMDFIKANKEWSSFHFNTNPTSDMLLNNRFNKYILDVRDKLILTMLETIRCKSMNRFYVKKNSFEKVFWSRDGSLWGQRVNWLPWNLKISLYKFKNFAKMSWNLKIFLLKF